MPARIGLVATFLLPLLAGPAWADSAPKWTKTKRGVVSSGGQKMVYTVGEAPSGSGSARDVAANRARAEVAKILLEAAKPPKAGRSRIDQAFDSLQGSENKHALSKATLSDVQITSVYEDEAEQKVLALALTTGKALEKALEILPLDGKGRARAEEQLSKGLEMMEEETPITPAELPIPKAADMKKPRGKEPPTWVSMSCGSFSDKRGTTFFGVGVVSDVKNPALARTASDNRARAALAKCLSVTVTTGRSGTKVSSTANLWGVSISDHWFGPNGTVYALAEIPEKNLPSQDEDELAKKRYQEGKEKDAPLKKFDCERGGKKAKGARVAMGVIGPEGPQVEATIEKELKARGFRVLSKDDLSKRAKGQLVLSLRGQYASGNKMLRECIIDVEFLRGTKTLNKGHYACLVGQDVDRAADVTLERLFEQVNVIKCNIADNLLLAASGR